MARGKRLPRQFSVLVTQDHYDRVSRIEKTHPVSMGDIIREAIDAGLPEVEARYANVEAQ